MTVKESIYELLCYIKEKKVVSLYTIKNEFTKIDAEDYDKIFSICHRNGYIENKQLHGGNHKIGTYDSNQFLITLLGRSYIEEYDREKRQLYWSIATTIIAMIILPIVLAIWFK